MDETTIYGGPVRVVCKFVNGTLVDWRIVNTEPQAQALLNRWQRNNTFPPELVEFHVMIGNVEIDTDAMVFYTR